MKTCTNQPVIWNGIDMIVMCMGVYSSTSCHQTTLVAVYLHIAQICWIKFNQAFRDHDETENYNTGNC